MSRVRRIVLTSVCGWFLVTGTALALRTSAAPGDAPANKAAKAKFEVYKDRAGEFRWRLRAQNTQILATSSDGYKAKRDCLSAIDSVKADAPGAPVEEMPEKAAAK